MTKQDYVISAIMHVVLFAFMVILSSARGSAKQFNPDDIAIVQVFDGIPAGIGSTQAAPVVEQPPELKLPDVPDTYAEDYFVEEEPIKLASIETPAKIAVKEVKKKEPRPKPKEKPVTTDKPTQKSEQKKQSSGDSKTKIGEGEVTTSIGVGDEPGGLGLIDFPYNIARAAQMIRSNWDNPAISQSGYSCVIYFQIDRQGLIRGVTVEKPSSNPQYDSYAKMAVERTKQLPPLPPSYKYDYLGFHLEFEYIP